MYRQNRAPRRPLALVATLVLATGACWEDSLLDVNVEDRASVIEDPVLLDERVEYVNERLQLVSPESAGSNVSGVPALAADPGEPVELKLVAEVASPELEGFTLQATHLALKGSVAYVSYNVGGATFKGAVDAFEKVTSSAPRLGSSLMLSDTDVSAVDFEGSKNLFLATGAREGTFSETAVLEVVSMSSGGKLLSPKTTRIGLPGHVATGIAWAKNKVFVTSGTNGGLTVLDEKTMEVLLTDAFDDARAVVADDGWVVAMKGSPAELRVYDDKDGTFLRSIFVGGATTPESKSSLAIDGDVAAVAVGEAGVKLVNLEDGVVLGGIGIPPMPIPDVVSNGVAIHEDLVFVANGAGGLWVARAVDDIKKLRAGDDPGLQWVGAVRFSDQSSINFVERKGDLLFAAGGFGGLKIIAFDD